LTYPRQADIIGVDENETTNEKGTKMTQNKEISKVEKLEDGVTVRVTFTDGTTTRMNEKSLASGSWKKGTTLGLVTAVNG